MDKSRGALRVERAMRERASARMRAAIALVNSTDCTEPCGICDVQTAPYQTDFDATPVAPARASLTNVGG